LTTNGAEYGEEEWSRRVAQFVMSKTKEAQLSQRDCAMLRLIQYFAKSLKVIRNDALECVSPF